MSTAKAPAAPSDRICEKKLECDKYILGKNYVQAWAFWRNGSYALVIQFHAQLKRAYQHHKGERALVCV